MTLNGIWSVYKVLHNVYFPTFHNFLLFQHLTEELPKKVDSITPYTMALIAKYVARHRLRDTHLLDTIANFLVKKGEYLDSKVTHIYSTFFSHDL